MGSVVRIAMVAGEASGDLLASHLIASLKAKLPDAVFFGIGGPRMEAQGFDAWWPMDKLSVMGYVDALKHYREISGIRRQLKKRLLDLRPDIFIGVDAPDFNLGLETDLKSAGIKTIHYVSPSIWAWRGSRIRKHLGVDGLNLCRRSGQISGRVKSCKTGLDAFARGFDGGLADFSRPGQHPSATERAEHHRRNNGLVLLRQRVHVHQNRLTRQCLGQSPDAFVIKAPVFHVLFFARRINTAGGADQAGSVRGHKTALHHARSFQAFTGNYHIHTRRDWR